MTRQKILQLAELSKLEFNEDELERFEKDFEAILNFVSQVKNAEIKESDIGSAIKIKELREDKVASSLSRDGILQNANKADEEYFIVPQVVE